MDLACWDPIHVIVTGDYVKNLAFNAQEVSQLSGRPVADMQNNAYKAGLLVGYPTPRKFLQWNVSAYYKYVGTDSVVDAFDDPDFHLGGTNAKGWIIGAELGVMKNVWLTARWLERGPDIALTRGRMVLTRLTYSSLIRMLHFKEKAAPQRRSFSDRVSRKMMCTDGEFSSCAKAKQISALLL